MNLVTLMVLLGLVVVFLVLIIRYYLLYKKGLDG
jgi:Na+-transporting methylmalonyl-CoA/oxaloacetate decarboxylase gamma subunit